MTGAGAAAGAAITSGAAGAIGGVVASGVAGISGIFGMSGFAGMSGAAGALGSGGVSGIGGGAACAESITGTDASATAHKKRRGFDWTLMINSIIFGPGMPGPFSAPLPHTG
jgi:hypothetical protein